MARVSPEQSQPLLTTSAGSEGPSFVSRGASDSDLIVVGATDLFADLLNRTSTDFSSPGATPQAHHQSPSWEGSPLQHHGHSSTSASVPPPAVRATHSEETLGGGPRKKPIYSRVKLEGRSERMFQNINRGLTLFERSMSEAGKTPRTALRDAKKVLYRDFELPGAERRHGGGGGGGAPMIS